MHQELHLGRREPHPKNSLARIEAELALAPDQRPAWRMFAETFDEAKQAISTADAALEHDGDGGVPRLEKALGVKARQLEVRLDATHRIAAAATSLLHTMTPRQGARASRFLGLLCVELGLD